MKLVFDPEVFYFMTYPTNCVSPADGKEWNLTQLLELLAFVKANRGSTAIEKIRELSAHYSPNVMRTLTMIFNKELYNAGTGLATIRKAIPSFPITEFKVMKGDSIVDSNTGKPDLEQIKFPCLSEIKYDGFRANMVVDYRTNKVAVLSSDGKPLPNITVVDEQLLSGTMKGRLKEAGFKSNPIVFDCEVYTDEPNAYNIVSSIMGKNEDYEGSALHIRLFAVLTQKEFSDAVHFETSIKTVEMRKRVDIVSPLKNNELTFIRKSAAKICKTVEDLQSFMAYAIESGYEGLMTKDLNQGYHRTRVKGWKKWKFEDDYDAVITGFEEGTGKLKGSLGAFTVDYNGQQNSVGGSYKKSLTDENRKKLWSIRATLLDKKIRVRSCGVTKDNNFRHARFIDFHE